MNEKKDKEDKLAGVEEKISQLELEINDAKNKFKETLSDKDIDYSRHMLEIYSEEKKMLIDEIKEFEKYFLKVTLIIIVIDYLFSLID